MESTWTNNTPQQTLEDFRSDFTHLKMLLDAFTQEMSAIGTGGSTVSDTASGTASGTGAVSSYRSIILVRGCSYQLVFPHGYDIVSQALSKPEGVHFAGFFSKRSSEASEDVMNKVSQTEDQLIEELRVSTSKSTTERVH